MFDPCGGGSPWKAWTSVGVWPRVAPIRWVPIVSAATPISRVWSPPAARLDLLLFDDVDDARPSRMIPLDPLRNRTSYFWHVFVPEVQPGQVYTWRVHGAFDPAAGLRHDASALLLDPYGVAVAVPSGYDRMAGRRRRRCRWCRRRFPAMSTWRPPARAAVGGSAGAPPRMHPDPNVRRAGPGCRDC